MRLSVCWQGKFEAMDRTQAQAQAYRTFFVARACTPKPHAHGPVATPGLT